MALIAYLAFWVGFAIAACVAAIAAVRLGDWLLEKLE